MKRIILFILLTCAHQHIARAENSDVLSTIQLQGLDRSIEIISGTNEYPCAKNGTCYIFDDRNYTRINEPQLKLTGRGIIGKQSKQLIALACVGKEMSCDTFRFVYVVNVNESYYVGPKFHVKDQKALKKAMKNLSNSSKDRSSRGVLTIAGGMAVGFASMFVFQTALPFIALFALVYTSHQSGIDEKIYDIYEPLKNTLVGNDGQQIVNQEGWNWSMNARQVNEKLFKGMLVQLEASKGFFQDNKNLITTEPRN